jgi:hypothetical protein
MSSDTFDTGPNLGNGHLRSIILDEARGIDAGKLLVWIGLAESAGGTKLPIRDVCCLVLGSHFFLVCASHDDFQRVIRQRPLQLPHPILRASIRRALHWRLGSAAWPCGGLARYRR